MARDYLSEAVTVRLAPETVRGVQPTAGWAQVQIDTGGISAWQRSYTDVERDVHSVNATLEKGDHVAYEVVPQITHDPNKDLIDLIAAPAWRCVPKHFGGSGQSFFRPSAVVDGGSDEDSFTVAADGDLPDGILIHARGFANSANNGTFVTEGTSTGTAIKVAPGTLTAEASPPANATLDVIGFQGASSDIEIDASGNLTSTTLDFTTLGIVPGMWIYLPTAAEATAMGSADYAFANYSGYAKVVSVAQNQLTLERQSWTIGAADEGTGKTVRVCVSSRLYRNWPIDDTTNYAEPTLTGEKADVKPGDSTATRYTYVHGCGVNTLSLASPLNAKITATIGMVGMTATTPLAPANRKGGSGSVAGDSPAQAYAPLAVALADAQNDIEAVRLGDSSGTMLTAFTEWTFTLTNNITAKGVQGVFGADDLNYGKRNFQTSFTGYHSDSDVIDAVDENRDGLWWDVLVRNHQFGFLLDMPNVGIRNQQLEYAGNQPVMISGDLVAFRDVDTGVQGAMAVFGWLPTE